MNGSHARPSRPRYGECHGGRTGRSAMTTIASRSASDEAALIRDAAERVLAGMSVSSIARDWNAREIPTAKGAVHGWTATTVAGILRNPRVDRPA